MTGITSPVTDAWLALSPDIRSRAEEIAGNNRPVSWPEVLLLLGQAMMQERERCAEYARAYLEDLAGCDLGEDEPENIASGILAGEEFDAPEPQGGDE